MHRSAAFSVRLQLTEPVHDLSLVRDELRAEAMLAGPPDLEAVPARVVPHESVTLERAGRCREHLAAQILGRRAVCCTVTERPPVERHRDGVDENRLTPTAIEV